MVTDKRHQRLLAIREREANKGRSAKLSTMLCQKFVQKLGSKKPHSLLNRQIVAMASAFAEQYPSPSDEQVMQLEKDIRQARQEYAAGLKNGGSGSGEGGSRGSPAVSRRESRQPQSDDQDTRGDSAGRDSSGGTGDKAGFLDVARDWRAFDVAKQIRDEEKDKKKEDAVREAKARVRQELAVSRSKAEVEKKREVGEKRKMFKEQEDKLQEYLDEQENEKKKLHQKHLEERMVREQQIEEKRHRMEREAAARMEREHQENLRVQAEMKAQEDAAEARAAAERKRLADLREENHRLQQIRQTAREKEAEEDRMLMVAYRERVEREEKARADQQAQRMQRYDAIGTFWANQGAGKIMAEEERRMELRILEAARKQDQANMDREKRDIEKKRTGAELMAHENKKAIEEKRRMKERVDQTEQEFARKYAEEQNAYIQSEGRKARDKRVNMMAYKSALEKQIEDTRRRRKAEDMNDTEYRLNSDIVKQLEADQELVTKVRERLHV